MPPWKTKQQQIQPTASNTEKSRWPIVFWSILSITTLIRFLYAIKLPLTGDEAYFWEWARHPALGYYDHPPMAGWILWFTRHILGDTVAAVRIPAVLAGSAVVILIHTIALDISGSQKTAARTALLAMGIPVLCVLGILYSTDTPVLAAGTLGGYFFHRAVNREDRRAWIWTGICFAIVLGSKFLGFSILGAAAIILILNPRARVHLRTPGPYIAAILSFSGLIPIIIWNFSNHWITFIFNFASRHSGSTISLTNVLDYLTGQALGLSPVVFLLAIPLLAAAVPVWREGVERDREVFAFLALVPFGGFLLFSIVTKVGIHWPAIGVPFLVAALGAKLASGPKASGTYIAAVTTAWAITITLLLIPLVPYILPTDLAYPLRPDRINTAQLRKIMGSPTESGKVVGRLLDEMGEEGQVFAFSSSYALSSLLAFYTPGHPQVTVLGKGSIHGRNHIFWFDPSEHLGENAVFVTFKEAPAVKDFIEERFETWETVMERDGPEKSLVSIIKCYGFKGIR